MQRSKPTSKPSPNLPEIESINSLQNGLGLSHFNTFYRMVHPHHFDLWFSCSISYKVVCPPVKCWLLHVHPMNYRSSINPRYVMFHPLSYHEPVIKRFLGFVKFFPVMLMLIKYHRNPSYAYNLILRFFCLKHPVFWSKSPSLAEKNTWTEAAEHPVARPGWRREAMPRSCRCDRMMAMMRMIII